MILSEQHRRRYKLSCARDSSASPSRNVRKDHVVIVVTTDSPFVVALLGGAVNCVHARTVTARVSLDARPI